jgi:hypothetical protein
MLSGPGPIALVIALLVLCPTPARAQSAPARDYLNTPIDVTRFFLTYTSSTAVTGAESDVPLPNNEALVGSEAASILYSFPLGDKYGGVALTGGQGTVNVTGPAGNLSASGFIDPSIALHANIFGAPALRADQFRSVVPQTFMSFHLTINAPLGSYNPNAAVNMGSNRWAYTPVLNLSITSDKGVSWIDLYAGGRFYSNNNAFLGGNQLAQRPLTTLTAHYSHNIGKVTYAAIGVYYDTGGETFVNGIAQHDTANGFRPAVSVSTALGALRLTLRYDNTASTPNAAPNNGSVGLRLSGPLF